MFFNPLETFEIKIIKICSFLNLIFLELTNYFFFFLIIISIISFFLFYNYIFNFIIPKTYQIIYETVYIFIYDCLQSQANKNSERFFVFIFSIFSFILISNLLG